MGINKQEKKILISEGFVDPNRYIYDLNDPRECWYDVTSGYMLRPINNVDALRAINLLRDCFAVESISENLIIQRKIFYPNNIDVWSSAQISCQAAFIIELYELLKGLNVNLFDGHPWNIVFEGAEPKWIDLGSLRRMDEPSGSCIREVNQYMALGEFFRMGYCKKLREQSFATGDVENMLKAGFESLADEDPILSYTEKFYRLRDKEGRKRQGTWVEYSTPLDIAAKEENLNIHSSTLIKVIEENDIQSMIDIGCNTGQYSTIAARRNVNVLALDIEDSLICELFNYTSEQNLPITSVVADLSLYCHVNKTVKKPFQAKVDLILAYAILHHMVHRDGYDFNKFFNEIEIFEPKILILGFVTYEDIKFVEPQHRRAWYNSQVFADTAQEYGYSIEIVTTENTARDIFICRKK